MSSNKLNLFIYKFTQIWMSKQLNFVSFILFMTIMLLLLISQLINIIIVFPNYSVTGTFWTHIMNHSM